MKYTELLILTVVLCLQMLVFIGGIWVGRAISKQNTDDMSFGMTNNQKNINSKNNKISIDEKKVVTSINTSNLEKKFNNITESKETETSINSSVNKLKNMKG